MASDAPGLDRPGGCYHRLNIQLENTDNLLLLLQSLRAVAGKDNPTGDGNIVVYIRADNDEEAGLYMSTESQSKTVAAGCYFPARLCRAYDLQVIGGFVQAFTFSYRLGRLQELPVEEFPAEFALYISPLISALQVFRAPTSVRLLYDSTPIDADPNDVDEDADDAVLKLVIKDQSLGNDAECQCVIHTVAVSEADRLDASELLESEDLPSAKCDVLATEVLAAIGQELTVSSYLGSQGELTRGAASVTGSVSISQPNEPNAALKLKAKDWAADAEVEVTLPYRAGVVDTVAIANPSMNLISTCLPLPGLLCLLRSPCMKRRLRTTLWIHGHSKALSARWSIPEETGKPPSVMVVRVLAAAEVDDDTRSSPTAHSETRLHDRRERRSNKRIRQ